MKRAEPRLLVESSDVLPIVDIEVAFPIGSLLDPIGKEGLAQLNGQLIRRGPRGVSTERFEENLARLGARMTIDVGMRSTRIRATALRRNLEPVIAMLAELIWDPALRARDFAKLKRQAAAYLTARLDDDQTVGGLHFRRILFEGHPYARPTSGTAASVRRVRLDDVRRFYRRHVQRGPFIVGMAGQVSGAEASELVRTYFPKAGVLASDSHQVPPTRAGRGRHVVIVDKPERTQTQLFIGALGARTHDRDLMPAVVSNTAFGGTFTGPLMQEVRATRGWSYGAYSRLLHSTQRDAWYAWSAPGADYSADCAALEIGLIEGWLGRGLPRADLDFAKKYLINSHCFEVDTPSKRLEARLDVELLGVPRRLVDRHDELVAKVTRTEANQAMRRRVSPDDLLIVVVATAECVQASFERLAGLSSLRVVPHEAV